MQTFGGKRPMSSMSPTLVLQDGKPVLALGSPGGSKIIGTVLNAMVPYLTQGQTLRQAVDAPRVVSRNSVAMVETELFECVHRPHRSDSDARGHETSLFAPAPSLLPRHAFAPSFVFGRGWAFPLAFLYHFFFLATSGWGGAVWCCA